MLRDFTAPSAATGRDVWGGGCWGRGHAVVMPWLSQGKSCGDGWDEHVVWQLMMVNFMMLEDGLIWFRHG